MDQRRWRAPAECVAGHQECRFRVGVWRHMQVRRCLLSPCGAPPRRASSCTLCVAGAAAPPGHLCFRKSKTRRCLGIERRNWRHTSTVYCRAMIGVVPFEEALAAVLSLIKSSLSQAEERLEKRPPSSRLEGQDLDFLMIFGTVLFVKAWNWKLLPCLERIHLEEQG